jgi:hypothetical protein
MAIICPAIAEQTEDTYVVTNNHYLGKAVVKAVETSSIVKGKPVAAPPEVVEHYRQMREFTTPGYCP